MSVALDGEKSPVSQAKRHAILRECLPIRDSSMCARAAPLPHTMQARTRCSHRRRPCSRLASFPAAMPNTQRVYHEMTNIGDSPVAPIFRSPRSPVLGNYIKLTTMIPRPPPRDTRTHPSNTPSILSKCFFSSGSNTPLPCQRLWRRWDLILVRKRDSPPGPLWHPTSEAFSRASFAYLETSPKADSDPTSLDREPIKTDATHA
ncbi:hypothetical protein LX32DRAFT_81585 [Colletotrichum zoysiae]|uniref:Uncharacterized protein n=1 Tax=Colletotrichum zoysiae TaxID=1216348 RepID=A0AAD9H9P7_9PEZI|nr:hypothetical protein LX32DRAFT_81585 [Colletotrichum zoysiae]